MLLTHKENHAATYQLACTSYFWRQSLQLTNAYFNQSQPSFWLSLIYFTENKLTGCFPETALHISSAWSNQDAKTA